MFKGIAASPGITLGKALVMTNEEIVVNKSMIEESQIETEIGKYREAVEKSKVQVQDVMASAKEKLGEDKAAIFAAQLDILQDPSLEDSMMEKIKKDKKNAELALHETMTEVCALFEMIEDAYMKERAADVRDICTRIMRNLKGMTMVSLSSLKEEVIIIAKDLTPSDTAAMDLKKVLAFATDMGGRTAHTSIMARSLEIPAVVGIGNITTSVNDGDFLIVDANAGEVFVNPDEATKRKYIEKREQFLEQKRLLAQLKELPATTLDGKTVELCANIGGFKDTEGALNNGAEGIGLYRTEFLYMDNTQFPTEQQQFDAYKDVAQALNGKSVIIRTLDIGGDKDLPYYQFKHELNPFLGWRAIRICLDREDIFKTQLRAILRASAFGKVRIMFPMIISIEELRAAKALLNTCKEELANEKIAYDDKIEVGIMVETPAAVVLAEDFAKEVDFFSIGTNDLTQYTLAVDRGNENIAKLYNSFHPAVIRSIKKIIDASHKEGKWTGMCGEFAGDEKAAKLLLGLGLDEFSMSAVSIPVVKNLLRNANYADYKKLADKALTLSTTAEIEQLYM